MEGAEETAGPELTKLSHGTTLAAGLVACLLALLGISGNLVTVVSLARDRKLRTQATTAFVISLAVSDLLFCAINLPLTALRYFERGWTLGDALCKVYPFFFYGNYATSLISMVAIAVNRYVMIAHFGVYGRLYTRRGVLAMVAGVWIFSFGWMVPPLLSLWGELGPDPTSFTCTIIKDSRGRSPKMFLFLLGFSLPCLAIITCYSAIFLRVRSSRLTVTSTPLPSAKGHKALRAQRREDLQLTKAMLTIFVVFLVTFLPAVLANVLEKRLHLPWLHLVASVLSWTSGVVNPFVYSLLNKQYKEAFRRTVCCRRVCGSTVSLATAGSSDSVLTGSQRPVQLQSLHYLSLLAVSPPLPSAAPGLSRPRPPCQPAAGDAGKQ